MKSRVALFRGINVGGKNKMPMADLVTTPESIDCRSVNTYIQSGNVVFTSSVKSKRLLTWGLVDAVESQSGFRPRILLLDRKQYETAVEHNPFPEASADPKSLHFFFLSQAIQSLVASQIEFRIGNGR